MNDTCYRMCGWGLLLVGLLLGAPSVAHAQTDTTYVVKSGDTLYSIAQRVGASVRALQAWNELDGTALAIGDTLRVRPLQRGSSPQDRASEERASQRRAPLNTEPLADSLPPVEPVEPSTDTTADPAAPSSASESTSDASAPDSSSADAPESAPDDQAESRSSSARDEDAEDQVSWQLVERPEGATWIDLALQTGITADSLWRRNDMPAQVPDQVYVPTESVQAEQHTVASGETLYSLAGHYSVSVRALQAANDLDATNLSIGQTLRIPSQQPMLTDAWAPPDTAQVAAFPSAFAGRLTASGVSYAPETLVGSHPTLPYHSVVLVSHPVGAAPEEARHVFVRIVDRSVNGPEVSTAAAEALELQGTASVALRVVWRAPE